MAHLLVMGVVNCLVSPFDKCFELTIHSNELNTYFLLHKSKKIFLLIARSPYCRFRFGWETG